MEELGGHLSRVSLDELKKDNGDVSLASVGLFFPRGIFFEILSWLPVKYLVRCKCVSFGDIVEEKLNVIVFEDHRKNKWSKTNIVIHLTFLKENPDLKKNIVPTLFGNGKLWLCSEHKDSDQVLQFVYNTESRKLTQIALAGAGAGAAGKRSYIACPSSVVTFKRNAIGEDTSIQTRIGPRTVRKSSDDLLRKFVEILILNMIDFCSERMTKLNVIVLAAGESCASV
ncbi:hypothetical protein LWI29_037196 [Acer saccharum]|uniref:F-box associated domain-containing protein n=1 Tax=Acer saccharum TaxID=4024 RepID=A0AA39VHA0_ACESA|nr:hypothetical protein LWI29_037196 [Acer saccharum]